MADTQSPELFPYADASGIGAPMLGRLTDARSLRSCRGDSLHRAATFTVEGVSLR